MNDPSQFEYHKEKIALLNCEINQTEEGYQSACPRCPWTSGIKESKELCMKAYYRHLAYVLNRLGE